MREDISHSNEDFAAFLVILHEALQIHQVKLFSYQLTTDHYHLVLVPLLLTLGQLAMAG